MPLNKVLLMGRFTADPVLRKTPEEISVLSATIAVDRPGSHGHNRPVDFIDFVAWRQNAEVIASHFHKGDTIIIEGSIQVRKWTDKNENNRRNTEVVISNFSFIPNGHRQQNDSEHPEENNPVLSNSSPDDEPLPWEDQ